MAVTDTDETAFWLYVRDEHAEMKAALQEAVSVVETMLERGAPDPIGWAASWLQRNRKWRDERDAYLANQAGGL